MIAVTFALPAESSGLVRRLRDKTDEIRNGVATIRGKIGDNEVEILHTGVGEKVCRDRLEEFLQDAHFDFLLSAGFAGALRDGFQAGDLVLAGNFSDPQLTSNAVRCLNSQKMRNVRMITSRATVDSLAERDQIARTQDADAVDMETEFIAQACAARDIRMLSLRAISDTPREPFPAPVAVLFDMARQRTNSWALLLHLLKHPSAVWRLIRFARQVVLARRALTIALELVIRAAER